MGLLLLVLLARVVVRSQWLAVGTIYLIMNLVAFLENTELFDRLAAPLVWAIVFFVLIRFGLVAGIAMFFFSNLAFWTPLTLDLSTWYAGRSILFLVLPMALLVYAYILSLAGRPLFQDLIPD
jgi:hypothetical protein